jgi:hypothetical protein
MLLLAFCLVNHSIGSLFGMANHALCQGRIMTLTCGIVGFFVVYCQFALQLLLRRVCTIILPIAGVADAEHLDWLIVV